MLQAAEERGITTWVEPFVGGGNMICEVPPTFTRIGLDVNPHTIAALIGIRDFAEDLPEHCTESQYKALRGKDPDPFLSWIRYVASFGGKFDAGYAREKGSNARTFMYYGKRSALLQAPLLSDVDLQVNSFANTSYTNCIIYCDPPYFGVTEYTTNKFNHENFWDWCRKQSMTNLIFVSEYQAPNDFIQVWEGKISTTFAHKRKNGFHVVEKLFTPL